MPPSRSSRACVSPARIGVSDAISRKTDAAEEWRKPFASIPSRSSVRRARSWTISQSGRDSPTGGTTRRTRWTRRSELVKVPSFSANEAAGSTTSASSAVSCRKMSCTTRKSSRSKASRACARFGSVSSGFSPTTYMQRMPPRRMSSTMSVARMPSPAGGAAPHSAANFSSTSGT